MEHLTQTYRVRAIDEDRVVGLLSEIGTTGVHVVEREGGRLDLVAYFSGRPEPHPELPDRDQPVRGGVEWRGEESVEDRDWQAEFRRLSRPLAIGDRFLIDPSEGDDGEPATPRGRFLLRLPARTAFGTGTHETTQLILEALERLEPVGRRVLDVGTGSGILALAAVRLGAREVVGFDVDLPSSLMAGQYSRANRFDRAGDEVRPRYFAGTMGALGPPSRFDVALVNVLPHRIAAEGAAIAEAVAPGGDLLVSGLLASEEESVLGRWRELGFASVSGDRKGEWVAWRFRREGTTE